MLKFIMKSLEGLDPSIAALYTKQGDQYVLTGIENVVHKAKLDEFRTNNIELQKKLDEFKDIDPAAYKQLAIDLEEAKVKLEGADDIDSKVQTIVEQRIAQINKDHKAEVDALTETNTTQSRQLETYILDGNVSKAAAKHKIQDTAVTDVILRSKTVFKVVDGEPVAVDEKGNQMYGADGISPLGIDEWVSSLLPTNPHLFQPSVTADLQDQRGSGFTGDTSKLTPSQKINVGLNQRQ